MRQPPPGDVTIRRGVAEDVPAILAIERASPEAPHWSEARYGEMFVEDSASLQKRVLLVAELGDAIAGYVVATSIGEEAELESIAVSPGFRRRGVGRELGEALLDWATEQGTEEIYLEVRATNQAACLLYESLGFSRTGIRKNYYSSPQEDAVLMTARLSRLPRTAPL